MIYSIEKRELNIILQDVAKYLPDFLAKYQDPLHYEQTRDETKRQPEGDQESRQEREDQFYSKQQMPEKSVEQLEEDTLGRQTFEGQFVSEQQRRKETEWRLWVEHLPRQELDGQQNSEQKRRQETEWRLWVEHLPRQELEEQLHSEQQRKQETERPLEEEHMSRQELEGQLNSEQQRRQETERRLEEEHLARKELEGQLNSERQRRQETERRLEEELLAQQELEDQLDVERQRREETERQIRTEQTIRDALENRCQEIEERENELHRRLEELATQQSRDWVLAREEVTVMNTLIGRGAWGEVFEGTFRESTVAVKRIHQPILSDQNRRRFEREMSMASRCRHPCLLQFIGATTDDTLCPLFVTELLDTSLRAVLDDRSLEPEEISTIALDVSRALNYLHLTHPDPIIHRDISSGNVLLWRRSNSWRAKVSDYGTANFVQQCVTQRSPGAPIYSAPEALYPNQQTTKIDVYSFGVLLCEMNIKEQPDPSRRTLQVAMVTSQWHRELIERCLAQRPVDRPNMGEVISVLERCREWPPMSVSET